MAEIHIISHLSNVFSKENDEAQTKNDTQLLYQTYHNQGKKEIPIAPIFILFSFYFPKTLF